MTRGAVSAAFYKVLEIYFEAFAERDADLRGDLLVRCLTPNSVLSGPNRRFAGYSAISEKIAGFHKNWPDCRLVLASGMVAFENIARSANAIVRKDDSVAARGETMTEFARDGRICRVVPLWQLELPPI